MKFEFKLRNLILLSVISTIVLSVGVIIWIIDRRLNEAILHGFDRKLSAVCSVTSAFLDARNHERLLAPRAIAALAVDPESGTIYGADRSFGTAMLVKIDFETGAAEAVAPLAQCPLSMTMSREPGVALGLIEGEEDSVSLVTIDLRKGEFGEPHQLGFGGRSIALQPSSGEVFVGGGAGIRRFGAGFNESAPVEVTGALAIDAMCFADQRHLVTFNEESMQVSRIDIKTGTVVESWFLPLRKKKGDSVLVGPVLAMARLKESGPLIAATDRLIRINPVSLEWNDLVREDPADQSEPEKVVPGFRSEIAPLFRSYGLPMRRIKERADLTFLYTQTLSNTGEVIFDGPRRARMDHANVNKIIYVLDANTDDDHSPIGSFDEENLANESIRDVYFKGMLHMTEIQHWERWGMIKSGFAPIQEKDGQIIGMAGADVSVQKIRKKTKVALSKVSLTALGAILLASLISLVVSRKLTQPLEALKDVALKIAAGQFGATIEETRLYELSRLSESFNVMSRKLEETVGGLEETNREWELDRRYYELVRHLTLRKTDLNQFNGWVELMAAGTPHLSPSGWTNRGPFVVGWLAEDQGSPEENLRFRTGLAAFLYHMLESTDLKRDEIKTHVDHFVGSSRITFFLADLKNLTIDFQVSGNPYLWSLTPGEEAEMEAITDGRIAIDAGTQYVICGNAEFASALTEWSQNPAEGDLVDRLQAGLRDSRKPDGSTPNAIALNLKPGKEKSE